MEGVNNGCLKKKKEFSFVTRESSEKKIFFMKEMFTDIACGILYLSIRPFCNTLEFIKKERIF